MRQYIIFDPRYNLVVLRFTPFSSWNQMYYNIGFGLIGIDITVRVM